MHCPIVFAHAEPASFNGALKDAAVGAQQRLRTLEETEPPFFHTRDDRDASRRLKPGVGARSGVQRNPYAGQTLEACASALARRQTRSPSARGR